MSMVECRDFFLFFFLYILRAQIFLQFFATDRTQSTKKSSPFEANNKRHLLKERVLQAMICQNQ